VEGYEWYPAFSPAFCLCFASTPEMALPSIYIFFFFKSSFLCYAVSRFWDFRCEHVKNTHVPIENRGFLVRITRATSPPSLFASLIIVLFSLRSKIRCLAPPLLCTVAHSYVYGPGERCFLYVFPSSTSTVPPVRCVSKIAIATTNVSSSLSFVLLPPFLFFVFCSFLMHLYSYVSCIR
jgi:hypothetical protein